jgi:hypothetical protein
MLSDLCGQSFTVMGMLPAAKNEANVSSRKESEFDFTRVSFKMLNVLMIDLFLVAIPF